jgi:hypothetical protein
MDIHNLATVITPNVLYSPYKDEPKMGNATGGVDETFLAIEAVHSLIECNESMCEVSLRSESFTFTYKHFTNCYTPGTRGPRTYPQRFRTLVQQRRDHNQGNPQTLRRPRQSAYRGKFHPSRTLRVPTPIIRHRRRCESRRHKSRHRPAPARCLAKRELCARRRRRRRLQPSQSAIHNTSKQRKHRKPRRQSDTKRRRAATSKRVGQPRAAESGYGRCLDFGLCYSCLPPTISLSVPPHFFHFFLIHTQTTITSLSPKSALSLLFGFIMGCCSLTYSLGTHGLGGRQVSNGSGCEVSKARHTEKKKRRASCYFFSTYTTTIPSQDPAGPDMETGARRAFCSLLSPSLSVCLSTILLLLRVGCKTKN